MRRDRAERPAGMAAQKLPHIIEFTFCAVNFDLIHQNMSLFLLFWQNKEPIRCFQLIILFLLVECFSQSNPSVLLHLRNYQYLLIAINLLDFLNKTAFYNKNGCGRKIILSQPNKPSTLRAPDECIIDQRVSLLSLFVCFGLAAE